MYKLLILMLALTFSACDSKEVDFTSGPSADAYGEDGYDKDGFDRDGFDKDGYDKDGLDKDGLDKDGRDKDGFDKDGYDKDGYDKDGKDKDGFKPNIPTDCEKDSINFEDLVTPVHKSAVTDQYEAKYGVTFSLSDGESPILLHHYKGIVSDVGKNIGWVCTSCLIGDVDWPHGDGGGKVNSILPVEKRRLGNRSLTGPNADRDLIVEYSTPVTAASGTLIDQDLDEKWEVSVYNADGDKLKTIKAEQYKGDGVGSDWKIESSEPFVKLVMKLTEVGRGGGFALDLFSPAKACN